MPSLSLFCCNLYSFCNNQPTTTKFPTLQNIFVYLENCVKRVPHVFILLCNCGEILASISSDICRQITLQLENAFVVFIEILTKKQILQPFLIYCCCTTCSYIVRYRSLTMPQSESQQNSRRSERVKVVKKTIERTENTLQRVFGGISDNIIEIRQTE